MKPGVREYRVRVHGREEVIELDPDEDGDTSIGTLHRKMRERFGPGKPVLIRMRWYYKPYPQRRRR